ncbi:MAG TPA: sensor histidine kinase [Bacteroidales bacterium]|nr:sensor histidine kinase [Bacteroidales bacterium]
MTRNITFSLLFLLPLILASGQKRITPDQFDSLYGNAIYTLNSNLGNSVGILKILSAGAPFFTSDQHARYDYLQKKIMDTGKSGEKAQQNRRFATADSLGPPDSLPVTARRYLERSMPDVAIPLLMRALTLLAGKRDAADHVTIELCEAYRQKQEYRKGIYLIYERMEKSPRMSDENRCYAWNRLAALYDESGFPPASFHDSVVKYSRRCIELASRTGNKPALATSQNELSYRFKMKKQYDPALALSREAVSNFLASGMVFQAMNALLNQCNIYIGKKDYRLAQSSLDEASRLAPVWENPNLYTRIYRQYSTIAFIQGDYRSAYQFLSLCNDLQSDFFKDRINNKILEQSARFDLFVKEQKIREAQKKADYNQRQIVFLVVISVALTLAFISSLFYFRLKRQGAIREKLIEAIENTENNERRRIARDLHDGLGPILSAINHYFQAYLDAKGDTREEIRVRLQSVISEAIDEVSRISHNISPHILEKHGLKAAINNLFAPLLINGGYELSVHCGIGERLELKVELTIYRCITELLSNTLRHAAATRISLDLRRNGDMLTIRYTDNGIGFAEKSGIREGMGLSNISNRVESLGGSLSLESNPGKGVAVHISLPV